MGMPLDPIDYDVVELRTLARKRGDRYLEDGFLWPEPSEDSPPLEGLADPEHERTWTGSFEERQKPYLTALPESERGERLVREWVERLVATGGFDGAVEALAYYEALGWVTEAVQEALHDYLLGAGHTEGGSLGNFDREDHVESLARVVALTQLADDVPDVGQPDVAGEGKPPEG